MHPDSDNVAGDKGDTVIYEERDRERERREEIGETREERGEEKKRGPSEMWTVVGR